MKLAFVVQRYGLAVNGGAELHARYVAEHLARHADVEVLTTCATDYVTWRNDLEPGLEQVNGVPVRRFRVKHERDPLAFGRLSARVFEHTHSLADELEWLDAEGPACPALVDYLSAHAAEYDFCIFFSYRYYHAFHGIRAVASRAILVPTAERDPAIGLSIFGPVFKGVRALMYNSPEEQAMIQSVSGNTEVPSVVVGVGSEVPPNPQPLRFRQKYGINGPVAVYVGRIDENKGCKELFDYFQAYLQGQAGRFTLTLIGNSLLDIPSHPRIRHLGFVEDVDKFDAIAASDVLIMPSYFESLSMVALEAWALGRPVLANARCDVLKGQCIRSNAGLYYDNRLEFVETLRAIEHNRWLAGTLGKNGRQFFRDQYDWAVIERKYLDMLGRLSRTSAPETVMALPGWLERRKAVCPPGADIAGGLPQGPVVTPDTFERRSTAPPTPPLPARTFQPRGHRPQARDRRHAPRRGGPPRAGGTR